MFPDDYDGRMSIIFTPDQVPDKEDKLLIIQLIAILVASTPTLNPALLEAGVLVEPTSYYDQERSRWFFYGGEPMYDRIAIRSWRNSLNDLKGPFEWLIGRGVPSDRQI